jgi:iron complex outermembrane receptor protein
MEEESIRIDLDQRRYDVEGALRFGSGAVRNVKARFGITDYQHVEFEGEEVGTRFLNDYWEGRVESEHALGERFHGALGLQLSSRDFEARGAEAFVPPSETGTFAVFAYEEFAPAATLRLQSGVRFERQRAASAAADIERTDNAVSLSGGASWDFADVATFSLSASRSVKMPNSEELFSNGPHAATRVRGGGPHARQRNRAGSGPDGSPARGALPWERVALHDRLLRLHLRARHRSR